jgi:polyisoprenyl-phosphate glycosyltransferase
MTSAAIVRPRYSVVVPVYNEEESLPEFFRRLREMIDRLDGPAEVIFVDDGSRDESNQLLSSIHAEDPRFKVVRLSRNFGHQVAITAGLDFALGEAVITMDADLQDPPEVIVDLAARWREGCEVVYAVREAREGETWFKRTTAAWFYRLFRRLSTIEIPADVGDFRLVDRRALDAFAAMRENNRYVRGMFSWVGFKRTSVFYRRSERFAGRTKYPLRKMLKFALDGIVSFSDVPLRLALTLGFVVSVASFMLGIAAMIAKAAGAYTVPGWASIVVVTSFIGGVQLLVLGMMGEYIARIHEEVKRRPLYIVSGLQGFQLDHRPEPRAVIATAIQAQADAEPEAR